MWSECYSSRCFPTRFIVATVTIAAMGVTEPRSDQDLIAATLTLTTSSGGSLEAMIVVEVTATGGTASKFRNVS